MTEFDCALHTPPQEASLDAKRRSRRRRAPAAHVAGIAAPPAASDDDYDYYDEDL